MRATRFYIKAEAIPSHSDNGVSWRGVFAAPGLDLSMVCRRDGSPQDFQTSDSALAAAGQALCEGMNRRPVRRDIGGYARLTANEFANALADLSLPPSLFADLTGSQNRRVMSWLAGGEDIPHNVRVILALLAMPGAISVATAATEQARQGAAA